MSVYKLSVTLRRGSDYSSAAKYTVLFFKLTLFGHLTHIHLIKAGLFSIARTPSKREHASFSLSNDALLSSHVRGILLLICFEFQKKSMWPCKHLTYDTAERMGKLLSGMVLFLFGIIRLYKITLILLLEGCTKNQLEAKC